MDHKAIVVYLSQRREVGPWWQQMVTVTCELQEYLDSGVVTEEMREEALIPPQVFWG